MRGILTQLRILRHPRDQQQQEAIPTLGRGSEGEDSALEPRKGLGSLRESWNEEYAGLSGQRIQPGGDTAALEKLPKAAGFWENYPDFPPPLPATVLQFPIQCPPLTNPSQK